MHFNPLLSSVYKMRNQCREFWVTVEMLRLRLFNYMIGSVKLYIVR